MVFLFYEEYLTYYLEYNMSEGRCCTTLKMHILCLAQGFTLTIGWMTSRMLAGSTSKYFNVITHSTCLSLCEDRNKHIFSYIISLLHNDEKNK